MAPNKPTLAELRAKETEKHAGYACRLFCCASTGCVSSGCGEVRQALQEALLAHGLKDKTEIVPTGCMGLCSRGPLVRVEARGREPILYEHVEPLLARLIVAEHVTPVLARAENEPFVLPAFLQSHVLSLELPFFSRQVKVVLANAGVIDPESLEDYLARDGYVALEKILGGLSPEQVITEIAASGLRGRGGGGYPTADKWRFTRAAASPGEKFVICNGDEGDPGAYMDRSVLEGDPHAVLEGLLIAAYAIGATGGWFYVRAEYPLAVARIEKAIRQARAAGLLGKNILGSNFSFDCEVRLGAGAFVCGEETALIASLEGRRGTPRPRPPYPAEKGLWNAPSCVNNVETLANVPAIIRRGGAWFAGYGTFRSKGTKVFALTGKVKHSGLIEVPMGISLREVVEVIGGGSASGKKIKAVQTGGPSGGVIPEEKIDTPVCYDHFRHLGSIMGSGGMIVMDEDDCLVDIAAFYLDFTVDESCGKCAPCRIGGKQLLELLTKIRDGEGTAADLERVRRLCGAMRSASLCGLGQTAPNPVISTLRYFESEYLSKLKPEATA